MSWNPDREAHLSASWSRGFRLWLTVIRDIFVDFYTCVDTLVVNSGIALLLSLCLSPTLALVLSNHRSSVGVTETSLEHALQKSDGADWHRP